MRKYSVDLILRDGSDETTASIIVRSGSIHNASKNALSCFKKYSKYDVIEVDNVKEVS